MMADETLGRFKELWGAGKPWKEISEELGWGRGSINWWRKKLGLPQHHNNSGNRRRLTDDEKEQMRDLREAGAFLSEIAKQFHCSTSTVNDVCRGATFRRTRPQYDDVPNVVIPAAVLADRDYRLSQPPRDLTGLLMGDPPLGLSALETRAANGRLG